MLQVDDTYIFGHWNPKPVQKEWDQFVITITASKTIIYTKNLAFNETEIQVF